MFRRFLSLLRCYVPPQLTKWKVETHSTFVHCSIHREVAVENIPQNLWRHTSVKHVQWDLHRVVLLTYEIEVMIFAPPDAPIVMTTFPCSSMRKEGARDDIGRFPGSGRLGKLSEWLHGVSRYALNVLRELLNIIPVRLPRRKHPNLKELRSKLVCILLYYPSIFAILEQVQSLSWSTDLPTWTNTSKFFAMRILPQNW